MFNSEFPAKNRRPKALPPLRIEIEHADGMSVLDPNGVIGLLLAKPDAIKRMRPLPHRKSDVSGGPAILYRAEDYEIALTPEEMTRYCARSLTPDEYRMVRAKFGDHFEIHDDFYDAATGAMLQPVPVRREPPPRRRSSRGR